MKNKLLILIKSHDDRYANYHNELYNNLETISRAYTSKFENVDTFYLKANPNLESNVVIEDNNFWIKHQENYNTCLRSKVITSLKYFFIEKKDYSHVFITNLSTFCNIKNILLHCDKIQQSDRAYATIGLNGSKNVHFPSGAGMLMSRNLILQLLDKERQFDYDKAFPADDVFLGQLIKHNGTFLENMERVNILHRQNFSQNVNIYVNCTHVRIKMNPRSQEEIQIQKELVKIVYGLRINI